MRTGQLDRVIRLESKAGTTRTPSGGVVTLWAPLATVFASRRDTLGSERVAAGVEQTIADTVFRIRWRGDITTATRLTHEEVVWDVLSVAEIGRREWLDLTCRRVTV